ncbi:MAG: AAA family ATPase [Lachnospiraceae bacterium]|nr:AAA family ATPase [Lachnospiraceae bacterium]
MNIKEAKEFIKDTVKLYLKKDEFGDYKLPVVRQRPVFMLGAPGIGKTAIMEQVASELGIALVSYSMTHHTRQSALGLPFIEKKDYNGETFSVSEYTMSEIIASVYDTMKESGVSEGILFLDEINCVSETLYPSMLQFLQYKTFGRHSVPEGWVIVTAGNPPEFNKAVREFDVVTLDRLKLLNVEADFPAWKEYAAEADIHGAILNYLETNREFFYKIESTVDGKSYVTARGWEDLSKILHLYEEEKLAVNENLVGQYIQNEKAVREFTAYYDLYNKYKETYKADMILKGNMPGETIERAANAPIDERFALEGLLIDRVKLVIKEVTAKSNTLKSIVPVLRKARENGNVLALLTGEKEKNDENYKSKLHANTLTPRDRYALKAKGLLLDELIKAAELSGEDAAFSLYNEKVTELKKDAQTATEAVNNMLIFNREAFGEESNEMLVAVTELTIDNGAAEFLTTFGSSEYDKYNKILMVNDREKSLRESIEKIL